MDTNEINEVNDLFQDLKEANIDMDESVADLAEALERDDNDKVYSLSKDLAEKKNDWGLFIYSEFFIRGEKVKKDLNKAERLLREAAKTNPLAALRLVDLINYRVIPSSNPAHELYVLSRFAASKGLPKGMYQAGICVKAGWGCRVNKKQAFEWILKAAKRGYLDAPYVVGEMYMTGAGTKRDLRQARYWFEQAVKLNNDAEAMVILGTFCYKENKLAMAKDYWKRAAPSCVEAKVLLHNMK